MHFYVIQQRRAISLDTLAIENASRNGHPPRCALRVEEQKKGEEQRNVVRDRRKRGARDTLAHVSGLGRRAVIV